jgi:phosphoribosyl-AMP cyclohydrolase
MNHEIDFDKMHGLTPAIVQDAASGEVLMLGFMNRAACQRTLGSGYVTFFSRTRNQLWTKGETKTSCRHHRLRPRHTIAAGRGRGRRARLSRGHTFLLH